MRIEQLVFQPDASYRVLDRTGVHTADEICGRALAVRRALLDKQVCPGQRVLLICENGSSFVAALAGIAAAGATVVLVDPYAPVASLSGALECTHAVCICWSGERPAALVKDLCGQARTMSAVEVDALSPCAGIPSGDVAGPDEPAVVFFSSGTTGHPKGIVLSHRAIRINVKAVAGYLNLTREDSVYIAKSMVHSSTLVGEVMQALHANARLVTPGAAVSGADFPRRVGASQATAIGVNPSLLAFLARPAAREHLRQLRLLHVSGSIVNGASVEALHASCPWIRIHNGYGLTELGPRVSQTHCVDAIRQGSVGTAIQGVSVAVCRDGAQCAPGEVGEIHVRSPSLLLGHLRDGVLHAPQLIDGAWRTGDLGFLDSSGDLHVVGRADDLIITASHNVNPHDVEEVVRGVPGVADCIVFGVRDDLLGQSIACLYTSNGVADSIGTLERQIRLRCAQALASHQMPRYLRRCAEIPIACGGKVSRRAAHDSFLKGIGR